MRGWNGGRGRDRTYDQSIKSRMLYQLSYASKMFPLISKGSLRDACGRKGACCSQLTELKIAQLEGCETLSTCFLADEINL
jgi:hypothetical protein